jgi:hypothetical protein
MRNLISPQSHPMMTSAVLRRLLVAWQHPTSRVIAAVGVLAQRAEGYSFGYLRRAEHVDGFLPFLGFPDLHRTYLSARLFPLFRQRVMDPRRPDYIHYLETLGLDEDAAPMEVLERSAGVRKGDAIMLFPEPRIEPNGATRCFFLVHGVRHMAKFGAESQIAALVPGDPLFLQPQPTNDYNPKALVVTTTSGQPLGYIPDLLLDYVHEVLRKGEPTLTVERTNGADAPWHLRLFVRFSGRVSSGYEPFSGPEWETFNGYH